MLGRARLDRRRQAAERGGVLMKDRRHLVGQDANVDAALGRAGVDLVVDVGDVADIADMVRAIDVAQQPEQQIEDDQHAAVADMKVIIDRRAAGVDAHEARIDRLETPLYGGSTYYRAAAT